MAGMASMASSPAALGKPTEVSLLSGGSASSAGLTRSDARLLQDLAMYLRTARLHLLCTAVKMS